MSILDPSYFAVMAIRDRLSDQFNRKLADAAADFRCDPFSIDFTDQSRNFLIGNIDLQYLEETASIRYPAMVLWPEAAQQYPIGQREKWAIFYGSVTLQLVVHLGWKRQRFIQNFDLLASAVSQAVLLSLNEHATRGNWPHGFIWNGDIGMSRSSIESGRDGLVQAVGFTLDCEVSI